MLWENFKVEGFEGRALSTHKMKKSGCIPLVHHIDIININIIHINSFLCVRTQV